MRAACITAAVASVWLSSHLVGQTRPPAPPTVRLYVFDLGKLAICFGGGGRIEGVPCADPTNYGFTKPEQLATADLSVAAYLIVHPKGTLMWDSGVVPDAQIGTPADRLGRGGKRTLKAQLAEIGYTANNLTYFALSHMHGDHTANANDFTQPTWLVQKPEYDAMFGDPLPAATVSNPFIRLKDSKAIILRNVAEHDVFGDGSVVVKAAYGHSTGHQVLIVRLRNHGPVALVGDLYHYPEERRMPPFATTQEINEGRQAQAIATRVMMENYVKQIGAEMWVEHDYAFHARLRKSPAFYD